MYDQTEKNQSLENKPLLKVFLYKSYVMFHSFIIQTDQFRGFVCLICG